MQIGRRSFIQGSILVATAASFPTGLAAQTNQCVNDARIKWPLGGSFKSKFVSLEFGANWVNNGCDGKIKRHTGIDYADPKTASAGMPVFAAYKGVVRVLQSNSDFGPWITLEHGGGCWTTTYWHVAWSKEMRVGMQVDRGQQIGSIFDLTAYSQGRWRTHLHFGYRAGAYSNVSNRGGLPQSSCGGSDPAFPAGFVNPRELQFI